ncbi:MAG: SH3 domain-containing protein [Caldilineaceae bacterium]|nr:SH3 domain-containing protein [Caldilineaceae bacterium]
MYRTKLRVSPFLFLLIGALFLGGCSLLPGAEPTATPTSAVGELVPTWTPTPLLPTDTPAPPTDTPVPPTPIPAEPTPVPTDTPPPAARMTITNQVANVRSGPGTNYAVIGSVNQGMQFDVTGKNPAGDWFQFCCVNGEVGWMFSQLATLENAQLVAVVADIPAPPPTAVPAPVVPTNTPVPAPPPAAANPCANIGGDGCKFRVTGGPAFGNNGGGELKLQLFFMHSGVDGGQPQGSYFIALEKDGQRVPVSDSVRSIALQANQNQFGRYNYEFKVRLDQLPGNNVAGNYRGWVLDGNGERDSQDFSFSVPDGQGEVWIQFDQG